MKVSRLMSTQHPDNVRPPFFADSAVLGGEDEVKEAFYVFSHLQCIEQLWDCEGKEVDNFVVKKLLTRYEPFFRKNKLGRDRFITLRVPNPEVEKGEAKILLETLESIPRSFDVASMFYEEGIAPIFEVAIPMITSAKILIRVAEYYKRFVFGKQNISLFEGDSQIKDWIGPFFPEKINIIPLVEDRESILNVDKIVEEYLSRERIEGQQRVWLARSDPALNYGSLANVLMVKVGLQKLHNLEKKTSVEILPILGCGSAPFRGNFKPTNVRNCLGGYPSVHTFTIQSAFKYDYEEGVVRKAIEEIEGKKRGSPIQVDEARCREIIDKSSEQYKKEIRLLAPIINEFAAYIPSRRRRKLHIGLFGYSRESEGIKLPRAITFCAALYSLGLPPEVLGLSSLNEKEFDYVREISPSFENDLREALALLNKGNLSFFPREIQESVKKVAGLVDFEPDLKHEKITSIILGNYKNQEFKLLEEDIARAGWIRGFLG